MFQHVSLNNTLLQLKINFFHQSSFVSGTNFTKRSHSSSPLLSLENVKMSKSDRNIIVLTVMDITKNDMIHNTKLSHLSPIYLPESRDFHVEQTSGILVWFSWFLLLLWCWCKIFRMVQISGISRKNPDKLFWSCKSYRGPLTGGSDIHKLISIFPFETQWQITI